MPCAAARLPTVSPIARTAAPALSTERPGAAPNCALLVRKDCRGIRAGAERTLPRPNSSAVGILGTRDRPVCHTVSNRKGRPQGRPLWITVSPSRTHGGRYGKPVI